MSGIVGSKLNIRGSGLVGSLGTDGQHLLSSGAGKTNVFETQAAADLTPVRQDILTLALKQGIAENHTKFNLPNSAIVKFEADADFNLGGSTTVARHSSEYIWAAASGFGSSTKFTITSSNFWQSNIANASSQYPRVYAGDIDDWGIYFNGATTSGSVATGNTHWVGVDLGASSRISYIRWYSFDGSPASNARVNLWGIVKSVESDGSSPSLLTFNASGNSSGSSVTEANASNANGWNRATPSSDTDTRFIALTPGNYHNNGNANMSIAEIEIYTLPLVDTINATGTALGTTNVPTSAVTEVSGVILLKNDEGTATLGTDVKVYFTADNSNFTEATSYTDAGTFSTGIKMIKLGKTTVTSGSDVRWKIVWANQSDGSKESLIYGIGLNY